MRTLQGSTVSTLNLRTTSPLVHDPGPGWERGLAVRRRVASLGLLALVGLGSPGCDRTPDDPGTVAPDEAAPTVAATAHRIDPEPLRADLSYLADDALAGRHTLSPTLGEAADYLAKRYAEVGLDPYIADEVLVPFALYTGAKATGDSTLTVHGKRSKQIDPKRFTPLPAGSGGKVRAEAVFVGYAAQADAVAGAPAPDADLESEDEAPADARVAEVEGDPHTEKPRRARTLSTAVQKPEDRPAYDDFEGVELEGKIAVVLLDLPGRPDIQAFFERIKEIADAYEAQATPLLIEIEKGEAEQDDIKKLHAAALDDLAQLVQPFLRDVEIPKKFYEPPETYSATLDLQTRLAPLTAVAASMPGPRFDPRGSFMSSKLERLEKAGVAGVVFVRAPNTILGDPTAVSLPPLDDKSSLGPPRPFPVVQVHWKEADARLRVGKHKLSKLQDEIDADFTPRSQPLGYELEIDAQIEPVTTEVPNLVGVLPGSDLADEVVVVGAHYDHIGAAGDGHDMCAPRTRRDEVDEICNGADDNASGSAAILAIARAMTKAAAAGKGPRRTVVFTHFAGEELGLWGSKALAGRTEFDPNKIKAMINFDMVGRLGRKGLAIGGITSSPAWMPILDEIGPHGMKVLYEGAVAGRSDHASFFLQGIPVLFLFTGTHADYHRAGDNLDQVNFEGLAEITELGLEVVERAADGRELPFNPPTSGDGIAPGLPGQDPSTVIKTVEAAP